jgi:hypothetical protein
METALLWAGIALAGVLGIVGVYWIYIRLTLSELPRATEIFQVPTADDWTVRVCRYQKPGADGSAGHSVSWDHGQSVFSGGSRRRFAGRCAWWNAALTVL